MTDTPDTPDAPRLELDNSDDPITWVEILTLLHRRQLLIRRIIDGIAGDPEPWDPETP